jgi:hypothetical protein
VRDEPNEEHADSDSQLQSSSYYDSDSSFSHIIKTKRHSVAKDDSDSSSQESGQEIPKMLTILNPEFQEAFGTIEYFSYLVKEHQSASEEVNPDDFHMPADLQRKARFVAGISLDYMAWELKSEYDDIEKKGTTDREQLCRIRGLLVHCSREPHLPLVHVTVYISHFF